jgi:hypothetical protein
MSLRFPENYPYVEEGQVLRRRLLVQVGRIRPEERCVVVEEGKI